MPILLKLYRCFCHDLKICMWFGYYPEIIFCHFFCNLNLVIFKCFNNGGGHKFSEFACYIGKQLWLRCASCTDPEERTGGKKSDTFSPTPFINVIKHEHSCKILYIFLGY